MMRHTAMIRNPVLFAPTARARVPTTPAPAVLPHRSCLFGTQVIMNIGARGPYRENTETAAADHASWCSGGRPATPLEPEELAPKGTM